MEANHIYQYSLLNALMDGVSETGIPVSKLCTKGNQGIGTFVRMNGELVMLDGIVYQLLGSGAVREAAPQDQVPFAMTTQFVPRMKVERPLLNKDAIDEVLNELVPHTANEFVSYRIEANFRAVKVRAVTGQEYKGQPLSELGKKQSVYDYEDVEGTIVGFRSPQSWQGFSVAGEHLHFISNDRERGGHVLEISAPMAKIGVALASNVHIELPTSEDFNEAKLTLDDVGIRKVEG